MPTHRREMRVKRAIIGASGLTCLSVIGLIAARRATDLLAIAGEAGLIVAIALASLTALAVRWRGSSADHVISAIEAAQIEMAIPSAVHARATPKHVLADRNRVLDNDSAAV